MENEDETELAEENFLQPKKNEFCAIICPFEEEVAKCATEICLMLDIQKDLNEKRGDRGLLLN